MKKLKGIVLVVILLLASIMMPFDVYADSYVSVSFQDSTIQTKWNSMGGHVVNFSEDPLTGSTPSKLTFGFNDNYYGFVSFTPYSGSSAWNSDTVFIAGGVGEFNYRNLSNTNPKYIDGVKITYINLFLPDSNVDLTQIIEILTAIEQDTTSLDTTTDSILSNLQSVLNQLIVSNGYLDTITKFRQYNFPIESLPFVSFHMKSDPIEYIRLNNYYSYPVFNLNTNDALYTRFSNNNWTHIIIFWSDANLYSFDQFLSKFNISTNYNLLKYELLSTFVTNKVWYLSKIIIQTQTNSATDFTISSKVDNLHIIPIFSYNASNANNINNYLVGVEFALQYGLTNKLLDNINIIANGTSQSSSAASNLESNNNQMSSDMNNLSTIENGYNQQFNNQLQQIDFSSPLQSNSGILPAANFVISIFNGLINNNPFSVLIIVVCILLIGKKVIGK